MCAGLRVCIFLKKKKRNDSDNKRSLVGNVVIKLRSSQGCRMYISGKYKEPIISFSWSRFPLIYNKRPTGNDSLT